MYLEVLKQEKNVWVTSLKTKRQEERYRLTNKLCLIYLEVKLQQDNIKNIFRDKNNNNQDITDAFRY